MSETSSFTHSYLLHNLAVGMYLIRYNLSKIPVQAHLDVKRSHFQITRAFLILINVNHPLFCHLQFSCFAVVIIKKFVVQFQGISEFPSPFIFSSTSPKCAEGVHRKRTHSFALLNIWRRYL